MINQDWTNKKRKERDERIFSTWQKECNIPGGMTVEDLGLRFGMSGASLRYIIKREKEKRGIK